jgi:hypothetical protein
MSTKKTQSKAKAKPKAKAKAKPEAKVEEPVEASAESTTPVDQPQIDELKELRGMVNKLIQTNESLTNRLEAQQIEVLEYQEMVANLELGLEEREADGELIERDGEIEYDPYSEQDPFKILNNIPACREFPEGQKLGWKSPVYRDKRGWRGWFPIEHGDEYAGENDQFLSNYIPDPPERMIGPDRIDNYVRRGDMVLARMDMRIANTRMRKRELLAKKDQIKARSGKSHTLRDGVEIVGKGATKAANPRKEFVIPAPIATKNREVGDRVVFPVTRNQTEE